jgi:hypothetical protein
MKAIDLTNRRVGRLVAIRALEHIKGDDSRYWECKCDCGKTVVLRASTLNNNKTVSCGCYKAEMMSKRTKGTVAPTRLAYGEASKRSLFSNYKRDALDRDLVFELTLEDFTTLTGANCFYCNAVPANQFLPAHRLNYGEYIYNGIDRVDNSLGYILTNCVACCKICNYNKKALTKDQYIQHCVNVARKHGYVNTASISTTSN